MYWSELIENLCGKKSTSRELYIQKRKTAARSAASEVHWRLPSSPIVEKKHVDFLWSRVVVVAVDILEDDAEDVSEGMSENDDDDVDDDDDDVDDDDVDVDVDDDDDEG